MQDVECELKTEGPGVDVNFVMHEALFIIDNMWILFLS